VVRPFGLRGELKVELLTDYPEQLGRLHTVYLGPQAEPWAVEGVRLHKGAALFKLTGCDDRTAAEALRGALVQIALEDAVPLEEGEYYEHQIVGLKVVGEDGTLLGKITEVISTGANDVYLVVGPGGELLLPAIESVILEIDLQADQMVVHLLEGLR
jgi:16S rRNA processing protein RimM